MRLHFNLTPRQQEMVSHPARTLLVGTGTKTGKSVAAHVWIALGILAGEGCAWAGPWTSQTLKSYLKVKAILQPFIQRRFVTANDSQMRLRSVNGGFLEPYTGENPQAIFGDGIKRFVIDEASRHTRDTFIAARTTTAATKGTIKLLFNVDHGASNWAVEWLLDVQSMTEEQRRAQRIDYMLFPTLEGGLVDREEIEQARRELPEVMFNALYLAIIPTADLALFKNLAAIFQGKPVPGGPEEGHVYGMGLDVARKHDYTSATVFDCTDRKVVCRTRFHELSWTLQYRKAKAVYDQWGCARALVDATGLGDPVVEELDKLGMTVEPYLFTEKSRNALVEGGIVACDGKDFTVCRGADEDGVLRSQMTNSRTELDRKTGKIKYKLGGQYDDDVVSWLLANELSKQGNVGPVRVERVLPERGPYDGYM